MRISEICVDNDCVKLLFRSLLSVGFVFRSIANYVSDRFAVRRPSKLRNGRFFICHTLCLSAVYRNHPYLIAAPGTRLPGGLREAILARWPSDDDTEEGTEFAEECREVVATSDYSWSLELARDGISFTPDLPRVVMACAESVLLEWPELELFLDAEGRAGLVRLQDR